MKDAMIAESIDACIQSSVFWPDYEPLGEKKFEIKKLIIHMRLEMLKILIEARLLEIDTAIAVVVVVVVVYVVANGDVVEQARLQSLRDQCDSDYVGQIAYAKMLLQIGDGEVNLMIQTLN